MKEIRSNFVKRIFIRITKLANSLKENTSNAVRDLLNEAVREKHIIKFLRRRKVMKMNMK